MNVCLWYQGVHGNAISNERLDQNDTRATTGFHKHMMSNDNVVVVLRVVASFQHDIRQKT